MEKQQEFVLRTIEERGVKFIRLWFTDVVGTLKMVAVAPAEVEGAFAEGLGIDGSSIEGFTRASKPMSWHTPTRRPSRFFPGAEKLTPRRGCFAIFPLRMANPPCQIRVTC